jgi:16S rRNA (cytosine1407-C5)-methyltransferase
MDLPQPFLDRLKATHPDDQYRSILHAFSVKRPLSIRINTLKTTAAQVKNALTESGIAFHETPVADTALVLDTAPAAVTSLPLYQTGGIYIQSLSSMLPVLCLDPKPDETVLDMAAAPGSKTTQIAALMENRGEIIANDIGSKRLYKLKSVLTLLGVSNTKVVSIPGQALWNRYPEYFHKVLLDAPCSMEGMFYTGDPKTFAHWSPKKVKHLAKLQRWMLRSAVSSVRVGGTVVYSTCTLSREENEEAVSWILAKEKGKLEKAEEKRILPSPEMEGFYFAKLVKKASTVAGSSGSFA